MNYVPLAIAAAVACEQEAKQQSTRRSEMKKTEEYICPNCGATTEITCEDWEVDGDSASWSYHCPHCDADWTEFFKLTYDGYEMNGIDYDEKGDEINA